MLVAELHHLSSVCHHTHLFTMNRLIAALAMLCSASAFTTRAAVRSGVRFTLAQPQISHPR